jgi:hypothetical protein
MIAIHCLLLGRRLQPSAGVVVVGGVPPCSWVVDNLARVISRQGVPDGDLPPDGDLE